MGFFSGITNAVSNVVGAVAAPVVNVAENVEGRTLTKSKTNSIVTRIIIFFIF